MSVPLISNIGRRFRTYEPLKTIEIVQDGRAFILDQMKEEMGSVYDKIKNKSYGLTTNTIDLVVKKPFKPGIYRVALLDPNTSTSIELIKPDGSKVTETVYGDAKITKSESLFAATTNAALAGKAIDSQFMAQTFGVQFGLKQKLILLFVGLAFGWLLGAAF